VRAVLGLTALVAIVFAATVATAQLGGGKRADDIGPNHNRGPATITQSPARLAALLSQPVPPNDLWSLAARLKLHRTLPVPRVVHSRSPDYRVGRVDRFWVLNELTDVWHRVKARIVCKTSHLYLYIQTSVPLHRGLACASARFFEAHIYPTDRKTFGSEWRPGIDDDPHVTLFYGHTPGVAGYFSGEDEYPATVNKYSNEREMMFISSDDVAAGTPNFDATAAHEFQHMIHWHMHAQDEAWDNEGASMLAQVVNGFTDNGVDGSYASDPVQLDSWSDANSDPNYGAGFLWWDYLYERFGSSFIHALLADSHDSGLALAAKLLSEREHTSLSAVFGDWVVANLLNNRHVGRPYGYVHSSIRIRPRITSSAAGMRVHRVHPYAPLYVDVKPSVRAATLAFRGDPSIPVIGAGNAGPFWWSNRCDFCDTSMTRPINLVHARHPVLTFQTWYDIEKDYDYAYVEASSNGGVTWYSLGSNVSTNRDPNGGNYGNGITGQSGHLDGNVHGWVSVHVGLTRFAGRRIELRFEYVTDDEFNSQSFAVKDIAVRAAHVPDSVGNAAWRLEGFVPVLENRLPMKWVIRTISYGHGRTAVGWISASTDGRASIHVPSSLHVKRVVLAIFGQAPKTTLTAAIHISARK
jgi:immune inhibitor A